MLVWFRPLMYHTLWPQNWFPFSHQFRGLTDLLWFAVRSREHPLLRQEDPPAEVVAGKERRLVGHGIFRTLISSDNLVIIPQGDCRGLKKKTKKKVLEKRESSQNPKPCHIGHRTCPPEESQEQQDLHDPSVRPPLSTDPPGLRYFGPLIAFVSRSAVVIGAPQT